MVKFFKKVKDKVHWLAISIKKNFEAGMKAKDISKLFDISKQRINYWLHHPIIKKRKRREKLNRNERNLIIKWAKDKSINFASTKIIQRRFNLLSKKYKEKRAKKKYLYQLPIKC